MDYIRNIDEMGGVIAAIETGFQQREIADASYHYQRQIESGEKIIVGVNKYRMEETRKPDLLRIGPEEVEERQVARLTELKRTRDNTRVEATLVALRKAAECDDNLLPPMLDAVRAYATVQEVCQTLVPAFGLYRETSVI